MQNSEKIYLFCFLHWESSSQWHYFYDYIKSCRNGHYLLRNKYNITWYQMQNSENIHLFCFPHWESVSVTWYLWRPEKTRTTTRRAGKNNNQPTLNPYTEVWVLDTLPSNITALLMIIHDDLNVHFLPSGKQLSLAFLGHVQSRARWTRRVFTLEI